MGRGRPGGPQHTREGQDSPLGCRSPGRRFRSFCLNSGPPAEETRSSRDPGPSGSQDRAPADAAPSSSPWSSGGEGASGRLGLGGTCRLCGEIFLTSLWRRGCFLPTPPQGHGDAGGPGASTMDTGTPARSLCWPPGCSGAESRPTRSQNSLPGLGTWGQRASCSSWPAGTHSNPRGCRRGPGRACAHRKESGDPAGQGIALVDNSQVR